MGEIRIDRRYIDQLDLARSIAVSSYLELETLSVFETVKIEDKRTSTTAFITRTPDQDILSFRGSASPVDFMIDLTAFPRRYKGITCHAGFRRAHRSVWKRVLNELDPRKSLLVTGHSLGGALAELSAGFLEDFDNVHLITFGKPNVYWKRKAPSMSHLYTQLSVVSGSDFVTRVPRIFYGPSITQEMLYLANDGRDIFNPSKAFRKKDRNVFDRVHDHFVALYDSRIKILVRSFRE